MVERFPDFKIKESQELKENSKTKILRKAHWPDSMSGPAGPKFNKDFETNLLAYEAKPLLIFQNGPKFHSPNGTWNYL